MMTLGWAPMEIFPDNEGVNNPIPERTEMRKKGLQYISHWLDDYRKSVCGKAMFLTSFMTSAGTKTLVQDIDSEPLPNSWHSFSKPCKDCYREWEKRKDNNDKH